MTVNEKAPYALLYPEETLRPYFRRGTDQQIAHFTRSLVRLNEFLLEHPPEVIAAGPGRPKGIGGALQYFKDETFVTLYAFVSLDLAASSAHREERERLYAALLATAFPGLNVAITEPDLELEKQIPAPKHYSAMLAAQYRDEPDSCHPVWYRRALGSRTQTFEGATHTDAMLTFGGDRTVMFEAKFLSDISASTTYGPERDQLTRNLDAGLAAVDFDLERFFYVFVTPERFRKRPQTRFYGYKLNEYRDPSGGPAALARDLPHLEAREVDFAELSRHIGWVTWEEICGLLAGSAVFCSREYPHAAIKQFFRERCLWPDE